MSQYLKSSDPDFDPNEIKEAFAALYDAPGGIDVFFEHGQWWVQCVYSGRAFSVNDAVGDPSHVCSGFSFEEV